MLRKVNNINNSAVKIFPNPFTNELFFELKGTDDPCQIRLYNILGKEIINKIFLGNQNYSLNTENLSVGLYLLQIMQQDQIIYSGKVNHQKN